MCPSRRPVSLTNSLHGTSRLTSAVMLAAAATLACTAVAQAATLRTMTTLHGPHVKLSDLFDNAGAKADLILGPGPTPGGRIVVGAAQLAAIARQFAVDWRPASSADRAVLDWPGRPLSREAAMTALQEAIAASGVHPENCEIDLSGFTSPLVPLDGAPHPLVSQLAYDRASGRFTAMLSVTADGIEPITAPIAGRIDEMIELPVATAKLPAGTVLRPEDLHLARVRAVIANREVVRRPEDAIGLQLRHQVSAGQPLAQTDLARPELVRRGSDVLMLLDSPGILLTAQGQALEAGAVGERIQCSIRCRAQ